MLCWTVTHLEEEALTVVNLISAALSVIGSLATILFFIGSAQKDKRQQLNQLIFFLAITDFIGSSFIIIGTTIIQIAPHINDINFCVWVRAVVNASFVSSFFWTTSIAIHMYRAINHLAAYKYLYLAFHVFSWGVPIILVVIEIAGDFIVRADDAAWCNLRRDAEWGFWFGPMISSIVINIILYVMVVLSFRRRESSTMQRKIETVATRRLSMCLIAFVLCWIWNVIGHIITSVAPHCKFYPLWILQDFFSPLQGFLNFIVYGLSGRMLQDCRKPKQLTSYQDYSSRRSEHEHPLIRVADQYPSVNDL